MRHKCFHLVQEWGGAVEDSVLLQGKTARYEFLKLCSASSACLFDLWQLDFCTTRTQPNYLFAYTRYWHHSAWQDSANRIFYTHFSYNRKQSRSFQLYNFFSLLLILIMYIGVSVTVKSLVPFNYHVRNSLFSWAIPVCYFVFFRNILI